MLKYKFSSTDIDVDEKGTIEGYGSKFGLRDQGGDSVKSGAFKSSLATVTPKMLWQHDPSQPIGKWMDASEDSTGLLLRGRLNMDVQKAREVRALVKDGAIDGLSIGYQTVKADRVKEGRDLTELKLWEVSIVTFPMLPDATVSSVKSIDDIDIEDPTQIKRLAERTLREAGFSAMEAKAAAATLADVRFEREATDLNAVRAALKDAIAAM